MRAGTHREKRDFQRSNKLEKYLRPGAGGGETAATARVGLFCAFLKSRIIINHQRAHRFLPSFSRLVSSSLLFLQYQGWSP